jgi:hypothetical protein
MSVHNRLLRSVIHRVCNRFEVLNAWPIRQNLPSRPARAGARWERLESLEPRLLLAETAGALQLFNASAAVFVENQGQWADASVHYGFQGAGANIAFKDSGLAFDLYQQDAATASLVDPNLPAQPPADSPLKTAQFSVGFGGANTVAPVGQDQSATTFNYIRGDSSTWHSNVAGYQTIAYGNLYNGIDLKTFGKYSSLKYEFDVAPGADYHQIQVHYNGIDGLSVAADGSLHVQTALGELVDEAPFIYQMVNGQQMQVAGRFELVDANTYTFRVTGDYDATKELVIDPDLAWSTYLGGGDTEFGYGVATDGSGDMLVTGATYSSGWVSGGSNPTYGGNEDAFIAKISPSGQQLWSTYLGSIGADIANGVAVDGSGNVLVAGQTASSAGWISGGFDTTYNGGSSDAFVAKLNASGQPLWSTYLGGNGTDAAYGIAVDSSGNVLVTGQTASSGWVSGGFNTTYGGSNDAFVVKLSASGQHLWSTYLGGASNDQGCGIAVDGSGNVLVTGQTASSGWVSGGFITVYNGGGSDAFIAKLSASGQGVWSTYLGGSGIENGLGIARAGIAVDGSGNVLVTGYTNSAGWVSGGFDTTYGGGLYDAFVAKVSASGQALWSTYLGGTSDDRGYGIAVDGVGNVLVTGYTASSGWVSGGFDTAYGGGDDAFVAKISASGQALWSSYLGGTNEEQGFGIALDNSGNVMVIGRTSSSGWVSGGFDTTYSGGSYDAFVAKISGLAAPTPSNSLASNLNPSTYGQAVTFTATVTSASGTPTGTVTFVDTATGITLGTAALVGTTATFTTGSSYVLPTGSSQITATYNGDSTFAATSSSMSQTVNKATATVTVATSPAPSIYGQDVTLAATVSGLAGTPTGTVQFKANGVNVGGAVTLAADSASTTFSMPHAGVYTITAVYSGDANFATNNGTIFQTVNKADQAISWATPAPIAQGQSLGVTQLDATVSGFFGGSAPGALSYNPYAGTVLAPGNHLITVTAAATADYNQTTDSVTLAVEPPASVGVTSSASTSTYGQPVEFTALATGASGTPTGTVQFQVNGSNVGSPVALVNGSASSTLSTLHPGSYTITAVYSGDANFAGASGFTGQQVNKANQTILWDAPAPILYGTALTGTQLDATVNGVAGGSAPGALVYSPAAGTFPGVGDQTLAVTAAATTDYNQASDSVTLTVNPASGSTPPVATLTADKPNILAGATETLTASVTSTGGTPTGSVTFLDGSTALQTLALVSGTAVLNTSALPFGVHSLTFSYSGDNTFGGMTSVATNIFVGQTAHQVIVNALYRQLLHRNAEQTASGLYYWAGRLDSGVPLSKVADGIATSVEYDTDIVTGIYQQYLHRNPDPTGLQNWVGQMQAGTVSYETIRGYILGSQEFMNNAIAQYSDYVTGLYETLLGRAPDPTGLAAWTQMLGTGSTDAQRDPVSTGISTSFEQYEDFVGAKFQQFLNRSPSAALAPSLPNSNGVPAPTSPTLQGEQGFWADALNHGTSDGDFIADILSSTEYLQSQGLPTT